MLFGNSLGLDTSTWTPLKAQFLKLVETGEGDFKLQRRSAVGTRQRDENAGLEALLAGGIELMVHGLERTLSVCGCDVIGKAGEVHGFLRVCGDVNPVSTREFGG
jgi:hypothetical protein